ncbi:rhodanese-like domain-containing protein [Sediminibacterium ginsengisoli]|uniref:Rhodanese-related sulfurtransferase n=1 Tax=Sediminibacterium ginsengisoli TaxID=413434 RepID=A0A1T4K6Y6_9BACT|nr:rhodanese-like domain-containing protein [Sediminibacterium ginsengisoli]SJZ38093.1 Rhodanese-related sulfurtransferase [Sediminibacterium ginsengisoli]
MTSITPRQLHTLLQQDTSSLLLIDVREPEEHAAYNIGGILLPLGEIINHTDQIPADKTVVLYCRKGIRSMIAIQRLEEKKGYTNLVNLSGGMDAWQKASATF